MKLKGLWTQLERKCWSKGNTSSHHVIQVGLYGKFLKRPLDFLLSLFMLLMLSPLLILIAVMIRIKLGSPVLFRQKRPGLNEQIFTMYKFRTMTDERDERGALIPNHMRITKFGGFLRSTSLDELPELFNILKGKMSLVGPRPLLVEYLPLYNNKQKRRHSVRPGLTGLAQVSGRNAITWEEKFNLDLIYIENITLFNDLTILFRTMQKAIKREGINSLDNVTMDKFTGT